MSITVRSAPLLWVVLFLSACTTISPFNQKAYEQATSLKVDSLALMDKAKTDPYSAQKSSIDALKLNVEKAYEYVKGLPKNDVTTRQWEIIKDPKSNSLYGFLSLWEKDKDLTARQTFVDEAKGEVSKHFDQIISLESGKQKLDATK
jgi:hypothetical protein